MHPLLLLAFLHGAPGHIAQEPTVGSNTPASDSWTKGSDEYGDNSTVLISPFYQYVMAEVGTTIGQLGGLVVSGACVWGYAEWNGGELPDDYDPTPMMATFIASGSILGTTVATVNYRPTQAKRSPVPAALGAATGLLSGFGIGFAIIGDKNPGGMDYFTWLWAFPSIMSSLGAVIGDAMGEERPASPPKESIFKPISIAPWRTSNGLVGMSLSLPLDL